jgi:hypothetical protein
MDLASTLQRINDTRPANFLWGTGPAPLNPCCNGVVASAMAESQLRIRYSPLRADFLHRRLDLIDHRLCVFPGTGSDDLSQQI